MRDATGDGATGTALVVRTGRATVFGGIADRLRLRPPETEFERGIRRYGYFAANVFPARPPIDSLLFAIALAVPSKSDAGGRRHRPDGHRPHAALGCAASLVISASR